MGDGDYDYVIVGSGAGGGPLAAKLASAGFSVLLLEAGGDSCAADENGRLTYQVPIFHALSTEYPSCSWNYFVRHYTDDAQQSRDSKVVKLDGQDRIWYPRAGTLGGCTAHNAMITVVPQDEDWNYIASITGDSTWNADSMRSYFEQLEDCRYVPAPGSAQSDVQKIFSSIGSFFGGHEDWRDQTNGHGFNGWLATSEADPALIFKDDELLRLLLDSVKGALVDHLGPVDVGIQTRFDPNDSRYRNSSPEGLIFTPLSVENGKRIGPREFLLRTQEQFPGKLTILQNSLVTRVLFENTTAIGVEFIEQAHLYGADPQAAGNGANLPRNQARAKREVILSAGAFNTPQLLMLSGVGPRDQLAKFGIPQIVNLPGVGANLQDRYEVAVVSCFARDFELINNATFALPDAQPDPCMQQWLKDGSGVYACNGALVGMILRSSKQLKDPDLYIFGIPGRFCGYQPGYSKLLEYHHNRFTWAILKARTNNTGRVELKSSQPWDTPAINFQYFGDGNRTNDPDLEAVVAGVQFARSLNQRLANQGLITSEEIPGPSFNTPNEVRQYVRDEAWGHHASCTCAIGADADPMAVLDSRFRVRGTKGLRVVDASVFPKIPGYFIVSAIYMVSERANQVIQEDA
ncbi:MAG TPA: GMC family oxidoreductase [Terracidiphilus sp.]|nr:GMC family oxidoreductase [Terracidiphilus sp.]